MGVILRADGVSVVLDGTTVLDDVTLDIVPGEVLALVGPNGAGKSTLLSVLSGDREPSSGSALIDGRDIATVKHLDLARLRSVLTQENQVSFPFRVAEVVEMGRSPWARTPQVEEDEEAIAEAVDVTDIRHLLDRRFTALSGGEKARVSLARVLAQRTGAVFLDEPTAALDLRHQEDIMKVARSLARAGRTVIVVLHDLSLAAAYADRVALIAHGALDTVGTPDEVLTAERIGRVYGLAVTVVAQPGTERPLVLPVRD